MANNITRIVSIDVKTQSLDQLDILIKDINSEIINLNKSEKNLNATEKDRQNTIKETEALEKQLQAAELARSKQIQTNLDTEKKQRQIAIKQQYTDEQSLNQQLEALDVEYLNKQLTLLESNSKEALQIQESLIDIEVKNKIAEQNQIQDAQEASLAQQKKAQEEFDDAAQEASEATQKKTEQLAKSAQGIGGAFTIAKSATLAFGGASGEQLDKLESQVGGLIVLSNGIKDSVEGAANGFKLLQSTVKDSTILSKIFGGTLKTALVSSGIGALIVGFGLLIAYFDDIKKFASDLSKDLGFDVLIKNTQIFLKSIGGISGLITIAKGIITGFVKDTITEIKLLYYTLTFQAEQADKAQAELGQLSLDRDKAIQKARLDTLKAGLSATQDSTLKFQQLAIDNQKAAGKETLLLEEQLLKDRIDINVQRLHNEELTEDQLKELRDKVFADRTALIANQHAQDEKAFNDSLVANQKYFNKQSTLITNNLKDQLSDTNLIESEKTTIQENADQARFEATQKTLANEIKIRKTHGEDVTSLQNTYAQAQLDNQTKLQDQLNARIIEDLDKEKQLRILELQSEFTDEKSYNDAKAELDNEFENKRLSQINKNGKEGIALQQSINDKTIQQKIDLQNKQIALDNYLNQKQITDLQSAAADQTQSVKARLQANQELYDTTIAQLNKQQAAEKQGTLAYIQLDEQKAAADETFAENQKQLNQQRIAQLNNYAQQGAQILQATAALYDQLNQNAQDKAQKQLDSLNQQQSDLSKQIDAVSQQAADSVSKINQEEQNLSTDRGARAAIEQQQLEDDKANQRSLQKAKDLLTKQQIQNQKDIDAETNRIKKLQIEKQKIDKANSIAQAIINTAIGVTAALENPYGGEVLAVTIAALGALQVAAIAAQPISGYQHGGYTEKHITNSKVVGVVHSNEYVIPADIVNSPKGNYLTNQLESMRINGYETGGFVQNQTNFDLIARTVNKGDSIAQQLTNRPIVVGVDQITKVSNQVSVIQKSAGF